MKNIYDTLKMKVSKTYGVVQIPNMNLFPSPLKKHSTYEMSNTGTIVYPYVDYSLTLFGDSRISGGAKNLEFDDLFNFKVGDEFHFTTNKNESIAMGTTHHQRDSTMEVILSVDILADTITYTIDFKKNSWLLTNAGDSVTRTRDTVKFTVFNEFKYNSLPYLPYHPYKLDDTGNINLYVDDNSKKILANELIYNFRDGLGCVPLTFGGGPFGLTLSRCFLNINPSNWTHNDGSDKTIKYYKSDCGEWGNKNILTSSSDLKKELIRVFPNPSNGLFRLIGITSQSDVVVFSSNGTVIKRTRQASGTIDIDLSGQSKGLYYCKIESKERVVFKKIVKF